MFQIIVSCGAVVYRTERAKIQILLVKQTHKHDSWGIPKGHMETGESHLATAVREVKEETGVDVRIIARLPHVSFQKKNFQKVVVPFLGIPETPSKLFNDGPASEVVDAQWFNIDALPQIYPYQKPIIDAALNMLEMRK